MSYEFAQAAPKAPKKGLLFIAPLVLQLIVTIDWYLIWGAPFQLVLLLLAVLIIGSCVAGILSFIAGSKERLLTICAAAGYSILILISDLYNFFLHWGSGYVAERIAWITGIPINFNMYNYGIHNIITSLLHALVTLSIPLMLVLMLKPEKGKARNVAAVQPFNNQQNQQGFGSPQGFSNAPTASYLPPIDNATRIGVQTNMNANPNAQWVVKIPGQQDQAVDTGTLAMWARSGVLRPESLVLDANSGMTYQANQIPGIFSTKQYVTTLLLSFFLGGLGVDRFYLGYTGMGVGKLLTLGGCGIWSLVDFILIAMRKVTDSQGNPLA